MKIDYAMISETGRRSRNEDTVRVMDLPDRGGWLGVLCDGLGGHQAGDIASRTVSDAVCRYWERHPEMAAPDRARGAFKSAAAKLDAKSFSLGHVQMGSTLVMAAIEDGVLTVAHCGDSRCYLLRDGETVYRTGDHLSGSFGWEVISRCFFSYKPEQAAPDVVQFPLCAGDRILLCSDGLYKSMSPQILTARMMDDKSPHDLLDGFAFMCEKFSDDNYSGILAIVDGF